MGIVLASKLGAQGQPLIVERVFQQAIGAAGTEHFGIFTQTITTPLWQHVGIVVDHTHQTILTTVGQGAEAVVTDTSITQTQFILVAASGRQVVFEFTQTGQIVAKGRFTLQTETQVTGITTELLIIGAVVHADGTTIQIQLGAIFVIDLGRLGCGGTQQSRDRKGKQLDFHRLPHQ